MSRALAPDVKLAAQAVAAVLQVTRMMLSTGVLLTAVLSDPCSAAGPVDLSACVLQSRYLLFYESDVADPLSDSGSQAVFRDRAKLLIDAIATGWRADRSSLLVAGHEDDAERRTSPNIDASRAEAVRKALVARGVDPAVIVTRDEGFGDPLVPSLGSQLQNRYVSVTPLGDRRCADSRHPALTR